MVGLEVNQERSAGIPGLLKEDSMTDDFIRSKGEDTQTNSQTPVVGNIMIASIANTDENLPGIRPPSINIRYPIISPGHKLRVTTT